MLILTLLAVTGLLYGSWRLPKLVRAVEEARRNAPAGRPDEPVGLTLGQIQFRRPGTADRS